MILSLSALSLTLQVGLHAVVLLLLLLLLMLLLLLASSLCLLQLEAISKLQSELSLTFIIKTLSNYLMMSSSAPQLLS